MPSTAEDLRLRLENARESLDTELKSWVDPATDTGKMEIARTCMALRNNNGGFLIIGIRDNGKPDDRPLFPDKRKTFHHDVVQEIISKYSSESFEITVHFIPRDGIERVIIEVPSGVRTPVVCRTDLAKTGGGSDRKKVSFLARNHIYVRTLNANGRPSTSPAVGDDWPRLMEHCFDNREADFGAFLRRQLSGVDLNAVSSALLGVMQAAKQPTPMEDLREYLDRCFTKYAHFISTHTPTPPKCGTREAGAKIVGAFDEPELTEDYINSLGAKTRRYSGWAPWVDILNASSNYSSRRIIDGGWESAIFLPSLFNILEFSRIDDAGRFDYIEGLRDDLATSESGKFLDFVTETSRVTEIVATVLTFSKVFCGTDSVNDVVIGVRWRGLKGRQLAARSEPLRMFVGPGPAHDDEKLTHVSLPVATADNAIGLHVENLVKPLFRLFGGCKFESIVIQQIVDDTLNRRRR